MESPFEKVAWLIAGILLSILLQNFVNDPLKGWRERRSKKATLQRIDALQQELIEVEHYSDKQGEIALRFVTGLSQTFNLWFFLLQIIAAGAILMFLGQVLGAMRGEVVMDWLFIGMGLVMSVLSFLTFNSFRRITKRWETFSQNITNFDTYKVKVNQEIKNLERRFPQ